MAIQINENYQNAILTGGFAQIGGGTLSIYAGDRPASTTENPGNTLLVSMTLPAFAEAADGFMGLSEQPGANASADGTASWFRITQNELVLDGDVGEDLSLNTTGLVKDKLVKILGLTFHQPAG